MKEQKRDEAKGIGLLSAAVQKGLQRLSRYLQQRSSRLSPKQLRMVLIAGLLLGTACCSYVVWCSLEPSEPQQWQVAPIKVFPLPPPIAKPAPPNRDTLH